MKFLYREEKVCFFFFSDDMVLVYEARIGVNVKLESCRDALESKNFQLSMD